MIKGGDFELIADLSASVGLTATKIRPVAGDYTGKEAYAITIQPVTKAVHINWHGADATTNHIQLAVGQIFRLEVTKNLDGFRAIEAEASANLRVHYDYLV